MQVPLTSQGCKCKWANCKNGGGRGRWDTTELKPAPLVLVMSTTLATGDSKGRGNGLWHIL